MRRLAKHFMGLILDGRVGLEPSRRGGRRGKARDSFLGPARSPDEFHPEGRPGSRVSEVEWRGRAKGGAGQRGLGGPKGSGAGQRGLGAKGVGS